MSEPIPALPAVLPPSPPCSSSPPAKPAIALNGGPHSPSALTDLRLTLHRNGYRPVPVTGPDVKGTDSPGKAVLMKNWPEICASANAGEIERWSRSKPDHTNTGVLCGDINGLDIDVIDAGLVAEIVALAATMFGTTPLRRTGRAPKALLVYRAEMPFGKIKAAFARPGADDAAIEVLAQGQQFVAHGIHPGTRQPYAWAGRSPLDTPVAELPAVTEATARAFVAEAEAVMVRAGYEPRGRSTAGKPNCAAANGGGEPPTLDEVAEALRYVPNEDLHYDDWVRVGMALKASLGDAALPLWEEWSARSAKDRPAFTARKWTHDFNNVTSLSARTIFYEAQQNGWINPRSFAAIEVEATRIEARIAEANATNDRGAMILFLEQKARERAEADYATVAVGQTPATDRHRAPGAGEGVDGSGERTPSGAAAESHADPDQEQPQGNETPNPACADPPHGSKPSEGTTVVSQRSGRTGGKSLELVCARDVVMRPLDWLWPGHLLRGAQEILAGIPGVGKSQLQCCLVAHVTTGRPWPDKTPGCEPANVIMLTTEDTLEQAVVPRLVAAGADLSRVRILQAIRQDNQRRTFLLAEDLDLLRLAVEKIGNVGLITIEPITAHLGKIDGHKVTEVRSQLAPLHDFAEEMNVAISTVTHPAKAASQRAIDQFIGSQAFIAVARIGHICVREVIKNDDGEKEETGRVLFANAKNNLHAMMPTLAYEIDSIVVAQDEARNLVTAPYVKWTEGPVDMTADAVLEAATGRDTGPGAAIRKFLMTLLANGPVLAKTIYSQGSGQGFSEDQLKRAKVKLKIEDRKEGMRGPWLWHLPGDDQGTREEMRFDGII